MPRQISKKSETQTLTAEIWPEGLNAQPASARVVSLAPGVICLATASPPAPGARVVAKFSIPGEFPIVVGCQARWRLERGSLELSMAAQWNEHRRRRWRDAHPREYPARGRRGVHRCRVHCHGGRP